MVTHSAGGPCPCPGQQVVALRPLGFCLRVTEPSLTARVLPEAKGGGGVCQDSEWKVGMCSRSWGRVERNGLESGMKTSAWAGARGPGRVAVREPQVGVGGCC